MTESVMRRARYLVLEALYESEASNHDAMSAYRRRVRETEAEDPQVAAPKRVRWSERLLGGVQERQEEIDGYIAEAAPQFPVASLPVVDRNILRLAIWELLSDNSAPIAAVVNEAVELAHRYGGESSPGFVNGVLRTISTKIQAARAATPPEEPAAEPQTHQEKQNVATVFERVRAIVVEQLGVDEEEVVPNASFVDDLNADSLDLVELIMSIEEEFGTDIGGELEIPDEDVEKIQTVQDAVDYLKDKGIEDK